MIDYESIINEMEREIINHLEKLDFGYASRKWKISTDTTIPLDILTVILKRLKLKGMIEIGMIFSEDTGLANGCGYKLSQNMKSL